MKLSKEAAVTGGEFKLYHILDDGTYEEVPVTVNMMTDNFGNEVVDTIAFTTNGTKPSSRDASGKPELDVTLNRSMSGYLLEHRQQMFCPALPI